MSPHECKGSKSEEVRILNCDGDCDWMIAISAPAYKETEFIEGISFCPWCGEALK